jgi:hypothetical protein
LWSNGDAPGDDARTGGSGDCSADECVKKRRRRIPAVLRNIAGMIGTPIRGGDASGGFRRAHHSPRISMVTQDFRADRLNIIVGADGAITSVECY